MRSARKWERVSKEQLCPFAEQSEVLYLIFSFRLTFVLSLYLPLLLFFLLTFLFYISNSLKHYIHILQMLSRNAFVFVAGIMLFSMDKNYTDEK
jgi:hypothetical protein